MSCLQQKIEPVMVLSLKRRKRYRVVFSNWMLKRIARIQQSALTDYESGGMLFGVIRPGALTISFATPAYPDDKRSKTEFIRRDKRHLRVLDSVRRRFGGTIGYLGEWHSHPNGPNWFSVVDFEEFANKVEEMRAEGATKPILEVLVSPVGLRCAVLALGEA